MRLVKLAMSATNPTVGAIDANIDLLVRAARAMSADGVTLGCFPEQVIGGYPAEDLVQWHAFVDCQWSALERFAFDTGALDTVFVLGLVVGEPAGPLFNVAAVVHRGRILALVPKEELPTYNVFYEHRTLSRGNAGYHATIRDVPFGDYIIDFDAFTLAVDVCEDAWSPDGPMRRRCFSGADLVVNISASPFRVGVQDTRREMLATRSADNEVTLVYANRVGGQDGLVFDGGGFVFQNGRLLLEAERFAERTATCVVDLDRTTRLRRENTTWRDDWERYRDNTSPVRVIAATHPTADRTALRPAVPDGCSFFLPPTDDVPPRSKRDETLDELFEALALGVKDYVWKTGAFRGLGIALSGGRDSLLTLLIAWRAWQLLLEQRQHTDEITAWRINAFYLPTRYSARDSQCAAERICKALSIPLHIESIDDAFERERAATAAMLGEGDGVTPITEQNIQARLRGLRMWSWANSANALFLQTSDMSEKAVGYVTVGGDLEGGLSVIANVPKTVVVALLERLHARFGFDGIRETLATTPSPELAAQQSAEAELMPFPVLDACLHFYAGEKLGREELVSALQATFPEQATTDLDQWANTFVERFTRAIFKWVQAPLSLHVGTLDLERERALQLPVVQRAGWS